MRAVAQAGQHVALARAHGQHDDRDVPGAAPTPKLAQDLDAVHPGHAAVEKDGIGALAARDLDTLAPVAGDQHRIATRLEQKPQKRAELLIIVDDEDVGHDHARCRTGGHVGGHVGVSPERCQQPLQHVPGPRAGCSGVTIKAADGARAGTHRPFPHHTIYAAGVIKPDDVPQAALDDRVRQFYDAWKRAFLRQGCGVDRYYVYIGAQPDTGSGVPISVSEGQSYGMTIVATMAGCDPAARKIFDSLYLFHRDHPSQHDPLLMAWRQLENCQSSSDRNSATDGDLGIAYALLLADRQWGSGGAIDYRAQALKMLKAIRRHEIHPESNLPQLGDWVNRAYPREYNAVRSSDLMLEHFRIFWHTSGDEGWRATLDASTALLQRMQRAYAPKVGLVPDFIEEATTARRPAAPGFDSVSQAGSYDYNACRVPWGIATSVVLNGNRQAKAIVTRMADWMRGSTGGDIYKLFAGYSLNGTPTVGYNHVCYTGAFGVAAMVDKRYQPWLNRIWHDVAITSIDPSSDYYGSSLRLIYMLVMSGNWWAPR